MISPEFLLSVNSAFDTYQFALNGKPFFYKREFYFMDDIPAEGKITLTWDKILKFQEGYNVQKKLFNIRAKIWEDVPLEDNEVLLEEVDRVELLFSTIIKNACGGLRTMFPVEFPLFWEKNKSKINKEKILNEKEFVKSLLTKRLIVLLENFQEKSNKEIRVDLEDAIPKIEGSYRELKNRMLHNLQKKIPDFSSPANDEIPINRVADQLESFFHVHDKNKDRTPEEIIAQAAKKMVQFYSLFTCQRDQLLLQDEKDNFTEREELCNQILKLQDSFIQTLIYGCSALIGLFPEEFCQWWMSGESKFIRSKIESFEEQFAELEKVLRNCLSKEIKEKIYFYKTVFIDAALECNRGPYAEIVKKMFSQIDEIYDYGGRFSEEMVDDTHHPFFRKERASKKEKNQLTLDQLNEIEKQLKERVVGQQEAQTKIMEVLRLLACGLSDPLRPKAYMMFAGPTGVGKTEIVKTLAELMKPFGYSFTRIDLHQYQSKAEGIQLFGSKRGYSDSEREGELTVAFKENPKQIVLFDETEKAHRDVLDTLLTLIDEGWFTAPLMAEKINCREGLFFFTTNAASVNIPSIADHYTFPQEEMKEGLQQVFKPEFLGRLDLVFYQPLNAPQLNEIIEMNLKNISKEIEGLKKFTLSFDSSVTQFFASKAKSGGIRLVKSNLNKTIRNQIANWLLQNSETPSRLHLQVKNNEWEIKSTMTKKRSHSQLCSDNKSEEESKGVQAYSVFDRISLNP